MCSSDLIERKGRFCALYSDRASHFFETPQAGGPVDRQRLTQVGRALKELGIQMIPAYSPQARGRGERRFGTWQGRLPQELRLAGITGVEEANRFAYTLHEDTGQFVACAHLALHVLARDVSPSHPSLRDSKASSTKLRRSCGSFLTSFAPPYSMSSD